MPKSAINASSGVDRVVRLAKALNLPEVELSTHYGDPCLKVAGKAMLTIKTAELMVLHCPLDAKEMLMEMAPEIYFQTDHFKGWPAVLIRSDVITDEELGRRLEQAWRYRAPRKLLNRRPPSPD